MKILLMLTALCSFSFLGAVDFEDYTSNRIWLTTSGSQAAKLYLPYAFNQAIANRNHSAVVAHLCDYKRLVLNNAGSMVLLGYTPSNINLIPQIEEFVIAAQKEIVDRLDILNQFDGPQGCVSDDEIRKAVTDAAADLDSAFKAIIAELKESGDIRYGQLRAKKLTDIGTEEIPYEERKHGSPIDKQLALPNCKCVLMFFKKHSDMNGRAVKAAIEHFKSKGVNCDFYDAVQQKADEKN